LRNEHVWRRFRGAWWWWCCWGPNPAPAFETLYKAEREKKGPKTTAKISDRHWWNRKLISSTLNARIFRTNGFFLAIFWLWTNFCVKKKNVQLLRWYSFIKKLPSRTVIREKLCKVLLYEKGTCKMLMKLTPGVYFIYMLTSSFYVRRSQKHKKTVKSSVSFCTLEICVQKSCLKDIDEIDPWSLFHLHVMSSFKKNLLLHKIYIT